MSLYQMTKLNIQLSGTLHPRLQRVCLPLFVFGLEVEVRTCQGFETQRHAIGGEPVRHRQTADIKTDPSLVKHLFVGPSAW